MRCLPAAPDLVPQADARQTRAGEETLTWYFILWGWSMGGWDPSLRDARFMLDIDGRFFDARALAQQFKRTGEIRIPGRGLDQDIQLKKNAINRVMVATGKTGRQEGMYLGHHHPSFGQYASYRQAKRRFSREKQQGLPARFVNVGREEDRLIDAVVALAKNRGGVVPQNAQALARELISRYESTYQRPFPFPIGISLSDNFGTPASSVNPTTTQPTKRERASPAPTPCSVLRCARRAR